MTSYANLTQSIKICEVNKMELMDIILKRRSVRKYLEEPIPEDKLEKILQAGLLAPTSRNLKPWEFYVV